MQKTPSSTRRLCVTSTPPSTYHRPLRKPSIRYPNRLEVCQQLRRILAQFLRQMTLHMATCGLTESGASKLSVPSSRTQEADKFEGEEKAEEGETEKQDAEDGCRKKYVRDKKCCTTHRRPVSEFDFGTLLPCVCLASLSNKYYPPDYHSVHISRHVLLLRTIFGKGP